MTFDWAALIAAAAIAFSWWGGVPRRTRRLQAKTQIFSGLPPESAQREALMRHIDSLVEREIAGDRAWSNVTTAWQAVLLATLTASTFWAAREIGGAWWFTFAVSALTLVAAIAIGGFALVRSLRSH